MKISLPSKHSPPLEIGRPSSSRAKTTKFEDAVCEAQRSAAPRAMHAGAYAPRWPNGLGGTELLALEQGVLEHRAVRRTSSAIPLNLERLSESE
eukprot:scaffold193803_cov32-Tisochrysis_lutea.AAC.8